MTPRPEYRASNSTKPMSVIFSAWLAVVCGIIGHSVPKYWKPGLPHPFTPTASLKLMP